MNKDLGLFILKHRERISPIDAGLRSTGRRRTPGLRREELAQLCHVSPTWIALLEQGRNVTASRAMLERLSRALELTPPERRYLFALAGMNEAEEDGEGSNAVLDAVAHMDVPAYFLDRLWNAVAWNEKAGSLFDAWLGGDERNLLKYVFTFAQARKFIVNWEERAARVVSEFRADCGPRTDDEEIRDLVSQLSSASAMFGDLWSNQDVNEREGGLREFEHPVLGRLAYRQVTLLPATRRDLKLVLLLPA